MKNRIKQLISKENVTSAQFAEEIGIGASSLHHIVNGRNNPSLEVIQKIVNRFPYINTHWLITGTGEPYKEIEQSSLFPNLIVESSNSEAKTKVTQQEQKQRNSIKDILSENIINLKSQQKSVSKIIILYSDQSFEVYQS